MDSVVTFKIKKATNDLGKEKLLRLYFVTAENSAKEENEVVVQIEEVFSTHSSLNKPEKMGKDQSRCLTQDS